MNLINRALSFLDKNYGGVIPPIVLGAEEELLLVRINRELNSYIQLLEKAKLRDAIRHIMNISRLGNQLMQSAQPWVLIKGSQEDKIRAGTVIGLCANVICQLSVMLQPFMPKVSQQFDSLVSNRVSLLYVAIVILIVELDAEVNRFVTIIYRQWLHLIDFSIIVSIRGCLNVLVNCSVLLTRVN